MVIPSHIAIIMDGNGRWAKQRRKPRVFGHVKGARVAKKIITHCSRMGMKQLTMYAFSSENWLRPASEVNFLMMLLRRYLQRETENLVKENIVFSAIGDFTKLPFDVLQAIEWTAGRTKNNTGLKLVFAISYGSRAEITDAVRMIAEKIKTGDVLPEEVDEELVQRHLQTSEMTPPDLVLRTSGEQRLSNFLLWQSAYSELALSIPCGPTSRPKIWISAFTITQLGKEDLANSQTHQALRTRILSALVAVVLVIALFFFLRVTALKLMCLFAVVMGSHELGKLLLDLDWRDSKMWMFVFSTLAVFAGSALWPARADLVISLAFLLLGVYALLAHKYFTNLGELQNYLAKTLLSNFYLGLFPSFLYRLLSFKDGEYLFFGFLAIVFAGDIAAYFVGISLGKHKLLPAVSPKKTLEGSIGGLLGSILFAEALSYILYHEVSMKFFCVGLCVGFVAQAGDLFESLMKRVSKQKDSGGIMPGHGGVLDRLDGVLFSAHRFFICS